jgi:hypothetical protein
LAQTIGSNLEAVIDPAVVLALGIDQVPVQVQVIVPAEALEPVIVRAVAQERGIDLAAVPAQVIVQAAAVSAQVIAQAAAVSAQVIAQAAEVRELETGPVVGELELRTVVAEAGLERGQVPAVAVRLRIKSATAAHPHGLVPLLAAAEDLAAVVVATMHARAATEVATAWEAAE